MAEELNSVVASWDRRALGYRGLTRRYDVLKTMGERLIAYLPEDFDGTFVDIGAGFGLSTMAILDAFPKADAVMVEPAPTLRRMAPQVLERYRGRFEVSDGLAEDMPRGPFDAAVSNVVMHLVDESIALKSIAKSLERGAHFAFNIWGHSWAETANDPDPNVVWEPLVDRALAELHLPARLPPGERNEEAVTPPRLRDEASMRAHAAAAGFEFAASTIDVDHVPAAFFLDFAAMNRRFLGKMPMPDRSAVFDAARRYASDLLPVRSARILLVRK